MTDTPEQQQQVDVERIGCKIVDVHACLQKAFEQFAESGDTTLEGLANNLQKLLSEIPVFLISTQGQNLET